jgi:hypothetical protein
MPIEHLQAHQTPAVIHSAPPHLHAVNGEFVGLIDIERIEWIEGDLSP